MPGEHSKWSTLLLSTYVTSVPPRWTKLLYRCQKDRITDLWILDELTAQRWTPLQRPAVRWLDQNFPAPFGTRRNFPFSQDSSTGSYSEPDESTPHPPFYTFNIHFNIIQPSRNIFLAFSSVQVRRPKPRKHFASHSCHMPRQSQSPCFIAVIFERCKYLSCSLRSDIQPRCSDSDHIFIFLLAERMAAICMSGLSAVILRLFCLPTSNTDYLYINYQLDALIIIYS